MNTKTIIFQLVEKVKHDELLLDMINDTLNTMSKYIDTINEQEQLVTVQKYNISKEELLNNIKSLDAKRRIQHNAMIAGIKAINRLCVLEGLEMFFKGNEEDRYEIADFAMEVVTDTFNRRQK